MSKNKSSMNWDWAGSLADWETSSIGLMRRLLLKDFDEEEVAEHNVRVAYMGTGPFAEVFPDFQKNEAEEGLENTQVTAWRLRYPELESVEISTQSDTGEEVNLEAASGFSMELFRGWMVARPGLPVSVLLSCGAMWARGFQIGRQKADLETRTELRRQFQELLSHALENMPEMLHGVPDGETVSEEAEGKEIDVREDVMERLEDVRANLTGDTYHVDLPPFTIEIEKDEDDAPAPRPGTPAATSPEQNGLLPWASGAPASEGVTAIRQARTGWDEKDHEGAPIYRFSQNRPFDVEGQFNIIVPRNERAFQAAEAEVAQRVLRDFGHRTARLHLACAAYATEAESGSYAPVPRKYVYDLLGLSWEARSDLSRDERDRRVEEEVDNLRKLGVQLTVLDGPNGREELSLNRVWDLGFHKWGQRRAVPDERELDTDEWRLLIRPTGWAQLYLHNDTGRQFGYFSRALIENIDWHNNPAAGDLAIELLKYVRFQKGASRDLTVARMLEICQLSNPSSSEERRSNRQKLERAILEQERWGWEIEWTRWPSAYRPDKEECPQFPPGYWGGATRDDWEEPFHKWKVTFRPPETLAEMNSRAEKVKNSAPRELEPKGWDDRIKAILDATSYSQAGLADTVEVSASAISRWKSGDRTPGPEHRAALRDIERRRGLLDS